MYFWITTLFIVFTKAQDSFKAPETCLLAPDPGNCGGPIREKWFFQADDQECRQFGYSGCQGNDNKFDTLEDCMRICTGVAEFKEEPMEVEGDEIDDEDDEFEIPLHLIDQVDRDESYVFSKKNINPEDLSALQEVVSEMAVSALQAREGDEEVPEEPLELVGVPSVNNEERVTSDNIVDAKSTNNKDTKAEERKVEEEIEGGGEPGEKQEAAREQIDEDDDLYEPLKDIESVTKDDRFVFQDKDIDADDMHALQEVMAGMDAMAMEINEEEGEEKEGLNEPELERKGAETEGEISETKKQEEETETKEQEETGAGDSIDAGDEGEDPAEGDDSFYDPLEVINNADSEERYTFRKGAMTPEDLSTLQELVSQMDTRAVEEEEEQEEEEKEEPHPLSYLPDDSRDTVTETPEGKIAKISAHGMNSNLMTDEAEEISTTDKPIVTTNGEHIKTTSPEGLKTPEEQNKKEIKDETDQAPDGDIRGHEEPVYNRLGEGRQPLEEDTRRITFMMPSESSKMGPFSARFPPQKEPKSQELGEMQTHEHPPLPPPPFFFNRLMTTFSKSRTHLPSREEIKKVVARKFLKKARDFKKGETQLQEKWPILKIFMAHFKPETQQDSMEFSQRRPDFQRRREYKHRDERRERYDRPFNREEKPRFREERDHEEHDFRRFESMGKPRFHRMEDQRHLSQISPKNKFTLLQVFVNKKDHGSGSHVSHAKPPPPPPPPPFHPSHAHYPHPPFMPNRPTLHPKHLSSIIPPYHPQLGPNTFLNIHPFYPHKPTISNRPPWRAIPFRNSPPSPPRVVLTTESASEKEKDSYACLLPLDTGMCKTYQVRWYFNKYRQQCELFFFGGCGGNANRFESIHDCKQICLGDTSLESDQPSSGEEEVLVPQLATVEELLRKEAARREPGETLVVTSPVYEENEIVTTPPQPIHRPENKAEAEQKLEESKEEAKEVEEAEDHSAADSYVITGMRAESSSEFIMVIVIMSVVGLAVVILVAVTVSHFIKKMNSSKKEKVLEAVIKTQMCADIPKMVYSPPPSVTPLPADVHTSQTA